MKWLAWGLIALDLIQGIQNAMHAAGVTRSAKYATATHAAFAVVLLAMGAAAAYLLIARQRSAMACLIAAAPWVIGAMVLLVTLLTSRHQ